MPYARAASISSLEENKVSRLWLIGRFSVSVLISGGSWELDIELREDMTDKARAVHREFGGTFISVGFAQELLPFLDDLRDQSGYGEVLFLLLRNDGCRLFRVLWRGSVACERFCHKQYGQTYAKSINQSPCG